MSVWSDDECFLWRKVSILGDEQKRNICRNFLNKLLVFCSCRLIKDVKPNVSAMKVAVWRFLSLLCPLPRDEGFTFLHLAQSSVRSPAMPSDYANPWRCPIQHYLRLGRRYLSQKMNRVIKEAVLKEQVQGRVKDISNINENIMNTVQSVPLWTINSFTTSPFLLFVFFCCFLLVCSTTIGEIWR